MKLAISFGVKTEDIEQARSWVEEVSGIKAEARESSDWGGDYYLFGARMNGEYIVLVHNRDVYDSEPVVGGVDEWPVALCLDNTTESSPLLAKLRQAMRYFVEGIDR